MGEMLGAMRKSYALKRSSDAVTTVPSGDSAVEERYLDIFLDIEIVNEVETLEDEANASASQANSIWEFARSTHSSPAAKASGWASLPRPAVVSPR